MLDVSIAHRLKVLCSRNDVVNTVLAIGENALLHPSNTLFTATAYVGYCIDASHVVNPEEILVSKAMAFHLSKATVSIQIDWQGTCWLLRKVS